jgi:hypothetical protein
MKILNIDLILQLISIVNEKKFGVLDLVDNVENALDKLSVHLKKVFL